MGPPIPRLLCVVGCGGMGPWKHLASPEAGRCGSCLHWGGCSQTAVTPFLTMLHFPASLDSLSQVASEALDAPACSCSLEDLGSLQVQESLLSAGFSSYGTTHKGATNRSCSSLDYSIHCGLHRTNSQGSPEEDLSVCSRTSVERPRGQEQETCPRSRSSDCSSEKTGASERDPRNSAQERKASPLLKPRKMCCGVFSQPAASQTYCTRCSVPAHALPHGCPEKTAQPCSRKGRGSNIVRSTSDPLSCSSTLEGT